MNTQELRQTLIREVREAVADNVYRAMLQKVSVGAYAQEKIQQELQRRDSDDYDEDDVRGCIDIRLCFQTLCNPVYTYAHRAIFLEYVFCC